MYSAPIYISSHNQIFSLSLSTIAITALPAPGLAHNDVRLHGGASAERRASRAVPAVFDRQASLVNDGRRHQIASPAWTDAPTTTAIAPLPGGQCPSAKRQDGLSNAIAGGPSGNRTVYIVAIVAERQKTWTIAVIFSCASLNSGVNFRAPIDRGG